VYQPKPGLKWWGPTLDPKKTTLKRFLAVTTPGGVCVTKTLRTLHDRVISVKAAASETRTERARGKRLANSFPSQYRQ
jgi:hypothetical protein